jgi:membrane-associated phospholipid phosphatase
MVEIKITKGISELGEHLVDLFWGAGYFGWQISTLYALYVSFIFSWVYFAVFVIVFLLSGWINHAVLKDYIDDPRPSDSTPFLASEHFRKRVNGMPSGHAQQTAFSLTFAYLLTGRRYYESWVLFLITVIQRYVFKNHTAQQLLVGSVLGFMIAHFTVYLLNKWKEHKNRDKVIKTN